MQTLANGVKYATGPDLANPVNLLKDIADSFSDAIGGLGVGKRQPRTFRVADQTEKATLATTTTLVDGDRCYVGSDQWWELYRTNAWTPWETTKAVIWPFAHTGITVGNGVSSFTYMLYGDLVHLRGSLQFGSTTQVTSSSGSLVLPFAQSSGALQNLLGSCSGNSGLTVWHQGIVHGATSGTSGQLWFNTGAAGGVLAALSSTVPRAWSSGDILGIDLRYRRNL